MFDARLFPTISICLNIAACASYAYEGDWRRAVYWLAAATLTAVVTF
jgi:hypothetical protein